MEPEANLNQVELPARRRRWWHFILALIAMYFLAAYLIIPLITDRYYRHHPTLEDDPRITQTSDSHPGDPLNVLLIGSQEQVAAVMHAAKWYSAAALSLKSDLKIAADTLLASPDVDAPVSNLFLFGRKEDLAFEQPVGNNPRQRHHVRFWKLARPSDDGRPQWIGSASYDERVGLSHTTGQITHHIASDVDQERDHLFDDLRQSGGLAEQYFVDDFHTEREGRNGGGDRWYSDGRLYVGVITAENSKPEAR